jgi:hypothetical protein
MSFSIPCELFVRNADFFQMTSRSRSSTPEVAHLTQPSETMLFTASPKVHYLRFCSAFNVDPKKQARPSTATNISVETTRSRHQFCAVTQINPQTSSNRQSDQWGKSGQELQSWPSKTSPDTPSCCSLQYRIRKVPY